MNTLHIIGLVIGYFAVIGLICQLAGFNRLDEDEGAPRSSATSNPPRVGSEVSPA